MIWIWQFNQQAEQTPQDYANTLLPRGITQVTVKTHDGIFWMNNVYGHPMVPSAASWPGLVQQFKDVGLTLLPWVVPRDGYHNEAMAHAVAAEPCSGSVIVDFEYHYEGFFRGSLQAWASYRDALITDPRTNWVACAPDPRQPDRDYPLSALLGFSAQLPQTYWHMFQQPWQTVLEDAMAKLTPLGVSIEPILDADAPAIEIALADMWCEEHHCQADSLWRMGVADADKLNAFGSMPTDDPAPPTEEPDGTDWHSELINVLSYIKGPVVQPLRHYKLKTVRAVLAELDRVCAQYGVS